MDNFTVLTTYKNTALFIVEVYCTQESWTTALWQTAKDEYHQDLTVLLYTIYRIKSKFGNMISFVDISRAAEEQQVLLLL